MSFRLNLFWPLALLAVASGLPRIAAGQQQPAAGMMRFPDVSGEQIVFSYADDLWVVNREGGMASPLASPAGAESFPKFSSDGQQIAFVGNYEGGSDIYVIPNQGGAAERITYHPARETLCDWTPDGKLLYSTNGFAGLSRQPQLFVIDPQQPLAKQLPVPYGTNGTIEPRGEWLAYTPYSRDTRTWKRYRGGMASDVWLFNLTTHESKRVTDFEGTDTLPMWHGDKLYYLSDNGQEHRLNLWSYDPRSEEHTQLTSYASFDIKWPSLGPGVDGEGEIVFQNGSSLYLLSLAPDSEPVEVEIRVPGDRPDIRPQRIDVSDAISDASISPSAKRVVVEARGDIWTLPAENGSPRNLTATSGVAERSPAWSPDGKWIAYFADASGEYELMVTQSDGRGETRQLTSDGNCFRYDPVWAPDSQSLTFTDKTGAVYLHSLESGETKLVDLDPTASQLDIQWSHDSAWLTYAKAAEDKAGVQSIWVYNVADGTRHQLTQGFFNDSSPVFDRKGDFIYFSSNRAFDRPSYDDVSLSFIYTGSEILVAMPLRSDVPHPLAETSDEEEFDSESGDENAEDDNSNSDEESDDENSGDQEEGDEDDEAEDGERR